MTIDQLIQQLQEAKQKFGNLEVRVFNVYDGNFYPPKEVFFGQMSAPGDDDQQGSGPVNVIGIIEA